MVIKIKEEYYVKNKNLLIELENYKKTGNISEELGEMIYKIAKNYSSKGSFSRYTWRDDMISEAVLTCIKYIHNFDPKKSKYPNPFSYITTICHNAFLTYIAAQKKHSEIKDRCYNKSHVLESQNIYSSQGIDYEIIKPRREKND